MRKFLLPLASLVLSAALAQSTADPLSGQLARFSGTHLAFRDCVARMADLEVMLGASGYGPRATRALTDGRVYAGWYDAAHHTTVMAVAAPSDDGQGYGLFAYTLEGPVRWTDSLLVP